MVLVRGHETKALRVAAGLQKSGAKLSDRWEAHCVDAFVLARSAVGGPGQPDQRRVVCLTPLQFHRRQLHRLQARKGGVRAPYGGTRSMGLKRGSWVTHPKWGLAYVGGTMNGRISLHALETGQRLTQNARAGDCRVLCTASWRIRPATKLKPAKVASAPPYREAISSLGLRA